MSLDVPALRKEFPLLERRIDGLPLTYLDCASTAPRLRVVLQAIERYHSGYTANVHRGVHALAAEANEAFEQARNSVAAHLKANPAEIIFTAGVTDSANLVAEALALRESDEVLTTTVEHHSNLLPWAKRAQVRRLPLSTEGTPDFERLGQFCTPRTRLFALHQVSNVLGSIAPVRELAQFARARGILTFIDGAQSAGHMAVDVRELDCDFFAFSGHKVGGPSGSGALYVRGTILEQLPPARLGGGMVAQVGEDRLEWKVGNARFEAGTPNIEGALGLGAALEFLARLDAADLAQHSSNLATQLHERCSRIPGVRVLGPSDPRQRIPLVALALPSRGLDAETLARTLSDTHGILVSAGRHCAHPLHDALGLEATLRASAWIHNDADDVERFVAALAELIP